MKAATVAGLSAILAAPAMAQTVIVPKEFTGVPVENTARVLLGEISEAIKGSTVCIRGSPVYRGITYSPLTKERIELLEIKGYHGSGYVYDTEMVNGKLEYLIATNNHVASARQVVQNYKLEKNELILVENAYDENEKDATKLEVIATDPNHDAAILRTVNTKKKFNVFKPKFGLPKPELGPNDVLASSGFPQGINKIFIIGTVSSMKFTETQLTDVPNNAYQANISLDPGQSGSPVFVVSTHEEEEKIVTDVHFIGLMYAGAGDTDTIRLITPYEGFKDLMVSRKNIPSQKPRLDIAITPELITELSELGDGPTPSYDLRNHRYVFKDVTANGFTLRDYAMIGNNMLRTEYNDMNVKFTAQGVQLESVSNTKSGEETKVYDVSALPKEQQERYNKTLTGMLNHFDHSLELKTLLSIRNSDVDTNYKKEYYNALIVEETKVLWNDWQSLYSELYHQEIISDDFFKIK